MLTHLCLRDSSFTSDMTAKKPHQNTNKHHVPSTILDLARNPEDVFRAPLNTTKLAPVTKHTSYTSIAHTNLEVF